MKYLKMLGLAAIAALGLMAFVGAGTASATKLCTDSACTAEYASGTTVEATLKTGTTARLTSGGNTIATCSASTTTGTTGANGGTWVQGAISALTWPAASCSTTTDTIKFGKLTIMWTSASNGTVEADETEVTLTLFGVSCIYGAGTGTHLGTITGGTTPTLAISTTVTRQPPSNEFLCPATAGWDAEYTVTKPHALFVGS